MKDKKIFFSASFMRCGNTVLTSILNQNPDLKMSPNSILPEMMYNIAVLKEGTLFAEQKDHQSFDNVLKQMMYDYYKDWNSKYIIDRSAWGTPANMQVLKMADLLPSKFICLIRPIEEMLGSFVKASKCPRDKVEGFCDFLMDENGPIGKTILSYENLKKNHKKDLLVIQYKDLCKNPKKVIKGIYSFLEIPYYKDHSFTNLKQVDFSKGTQTKIRTDSVKLIPYRYTDYITEYTEKKYANTFRNTRRKNRR
tara:strand:+ start:338 stop:1093 length:756 start_codon:yes stop_codon:yes gene_type:complete